MQSNAPYRFNLLRNKFAHQVQYEYSAESVYQPLFVSDDRVPESKFCSPDMLRYLCMCKCDDAEWVLLPIPFCEKKDSQLPTLPNFYLGSCPN